MHKAFSVAVLVLALGCPALAGEIHNPAPQPIKITTAEDAADDEIYTQPPAVDMAAEAMLNLLESVLALF
jgi:hypothetical protein